MAVIGRVVHGKSHEAVHEHSSGVLVHLVFDGSLWRGIAIVTSTCLRTDVPDHFSRGS